MIDRQISWLIVLLFLALAVTGCSSDGSSTTTSSGGVTTSGVLNEDGIDTGIAAAPTTVAGKVTLSSVLTSQVNAKAAREKALRFGKPGSQEYKKAMAKATTKQKSANGRELPSFAAGAAFTGGQVYLYNASRPEWKLPVAKAITDSDGVYTLTELINAAENGNAYVDGDPIPGGNYTLMAFTLKGLFPDLVALQSVVSEFAGTVPGIDLEAQKSTASPTVTSMLGVSKNPDGTQTWGDESLELAPNAAVQVSFSMPMFREAVTKDFLVIESSDGGDVPEGIWTLSADWLTATFYPNKDTTWTPGKTYAVTVMGSDGDQGVIGSIYNIYGRFLEETGVGTFKVLTLEEGETLADLIDSVAPTASLSSPLDQAGVDVTVPIRIWSNERMDVNGLRLRAEPSLGAQPGVLFVGQRKDGFGRDGFEYEFLLGEPLKLNTSYDLTVTGGKDLAGNKMNELNASFGTVGQSEGIAAIDDSLTGVELETAIKASNNQADVKDVFGKWVRAFNDRNLPQLQSLMSGEFEMQYNAADGYRKDDVNRDGAFDLDEFSEMIGSSFLVWDHCEIRMTGKVVGDINVVLPEADFAFTLTSDAGVTSPECKQAAVDQELFANLLKVNGAWFIKRASEGVDNREQEVVAAAALELVAPLENDDTIKFYDEVNNKELDVEFKWTEVADAASYIWMVFDSRNPASGMALILPSTMVSLNVPGDIDTLMEAGTVAEVAKEFGFTDRFEPRDGAELVWQVAALGKNDVGAVSGGRATDLPGDVIAISELWKFKIPGEYQTLAYSVVTNNSDLQFFRESKNTAINYADRLNGTDGDAVTFNEFINGFDAGSSDFVTITVTAPRASDSTEPMQGFIEINGNTRIEKLIQFDANGKGSITVPLNSGINQVMISDEVPCWYQNGDCSNDDGDRGIEEWFQVVTTGGIKPIVFFGDGVDASGVTAIDVDGVETVLVDNDGWGWFESTDAVKLKLTGKVNVLASIFQNAGAPNGVRIDVGNESGARAVSKAQIDVDGNFSVEVEIYNGDNWVNVSTSICTEQNTDGFCPDYARRDFQDHFGINTQAGSVYVPPIGDILVTNVDDGTVVAQKENWGDGGRWNASAVTGNVVTISGVMEFATDTSGGDREPRYSVGNEGGWMDEKLSVGLDGSFSFQAELVHGDNWIDIRDVSDNNYHLNIRTDLGKEVVRPEITKIIADGVEIAFTGGDFTTTACSITIEGTAMEGQVQAQWRGEKEVQDAIDTAVGSKRDWYGEEVRTEAVFASATAEDATFSITVPLVGSSTVWSDNFIDINDQNYNWMGLRIINTGDCDYEAPEMAVTAVKDDAGNTLGKISDWGNGGEYGPAGSSLLKAFPGSVGLEVFAPQDGTVGLGVGTTISGNVDLSVFPMTGSEVVRILVVDPATHEPMMMLSSSSSDPMLGNLSGDIFVVDPSSGDFSATVDLDSSKPYIIEVLAWTDMNAVAADGEPVDPEAGHKIPVNGAVLADNGGVCDPSTQTCDDNRNGGDTTGGCEPNCGDTTGGDFGGSQSVLTDSITIEGTSSVAGRTINIQLEGCSGPENYEAIADADGVWVSPAITVYSGHNFMNVSNGPQWYHVSLNAESIAELPAPALVVSVTGATEVEDQNKAAECGRSMWDAAAADTVTVTGETTAPDGEGEWRADGQFGRFKIENGVFTIENLILYNGENRFEINDTQWNRHELLITTTGGSTRPQFVAIDQTALTVGTGQVITGMIYGKAMDGLQADLFVPRNVNVNIHIDGMNFDFVSDPNELQGRPNAEVMTLTSVTDDAGNPTGDHSFRVNVDVPATTHDSTATATSAPQVWVNVWVDGDVVDSNGNHNWANHGINTVINDMCTDCNNTNYYKPKVR